MTTKRWLVDLIRIGILLLLAGVALYLFDPANVVVFQALGIGIFLVGGTHFTRRVLFHKMDIQDIANKAVQERSLPAAVVFAAICAFLIAVMFLSMSILK